MWQQIELALRQSAQQVLVKLARFLPGLFALLLAVIILTAIGAGLAALLRRSLVAAKFDERLARSASTTISDWSPAHSPTALIAQGRLLGVHPYRMLHRHLCLRRRVSRRLPDLRLCLPLPHPCRWRRPAADCRHLDSPLSRTLGTDRGRQRQAAVCTLLIARHQVARPRTHRRNGSRPSADRRRRRRTRLRHSLRRYCSHPRARCRPRLARYRQPLSGTQRRPAHLTRPHSRRPRLQNVGSP